ncbi:hypothetical protein [Aureimonas sp. ME7]|uniref:GHMP family kinase ATP-binding protein n=1 Tax=Aureimonas sp. ME7 TaxID=2744252 RepID=UPI0015F6BAFA|nr:hypothetical protein [Aureimonas sp. ME7]
MQGAIGGQDFLVNCPIDTFACATARVVPERGLALAEPDQHQKVRRLADALAERFGVELTHEVRIDSAIPRGKGMASSTADLTAALSALCRCSRISLTPAETGTLLASVEPSDCVHYAGIAWVNHLTGHRLGAWTAPAHLRVIVIDGGGEVDTVGFDRDRARAVYARQEAIVRAYVELLGRSLCLGDLEGIGEAARQSARLSQEILPKAHFAPLERIADKEGALGVNCAHSGTVLGLLYTERGEGDAGERLRRSVEAEFGTDAPIVGDYAVVGGGCWMGR